MDKNQSNDDEFYRLRVVATGVIGVSEAAEVLGVTHPNLASGSTTDD